MDFNTETSIPEGYNNIKALFREHGMECNDDVCSIILEPLYNITRDILTEAKNLASFVDSNIITEAEMEVAAKRTMSSIELNIQSTLETIKESSESINTQALPIIKSYSGIKFPHDRNNLTAPNFEVKLRNELELPMPQPIHQLSFAQQYLSRNLSGMNPYFVPN